MKTDFKSLGNKLLKDMTPEELEANRIKWQILYPGRLGSWWREFYKRITGKDWSNAVR